MNIKEQTNAIYNELQISDEVLRYCEKILDDIKPRFEIGRASSRERV